MQQAVLNFHCNACFFKCSFFDFSNQGETDLMILFTIKSLNTSSAPVRDSRNGKFRMFRDPRTMAKIITIRQLDFITSAKMRLAFLRKPYEI